MLLVYLFTFYNAERGRDGINECSSSTIAIDLADKDKGITTLLEEQSIYKFIKNLQD